ncbi:uncharacterized protein LOC130300085 [Hyla sarda]|uniref:uncharacterized protein LOC130300085 n=1 Tax=Hyla sarda TaxID=327740 RepID=UPI0024C29C7A|nr:uncharacterized protein LOC130300085 [Hyla sarda]
MFYELRKVGASPGWLMMYHGEPKVHSSYEGRGHYFPNKSFLLTNLTKEDNGVYEQKLNRKTLLHVVLIVIDPVEEPVLRRQDDDNESCRITLVCDGWDRDSSNITFSKNGVAINRNVSSIRNDSLLVIDGTDHQHWGNYSCTVTNRVSQKVSQEMVLTPEEVIGASVFFIISCIEVVIYICHLISLLFTSKEKKTPLLLKVLFNSKHLSGTIMELTTFSLILYLFHDWLSSVAGAIIVTTISSIILVRCFFWLMVCDVPLPEVAITVINDVLFSADLLLVPMVFGVNMDLYLQGSDLCGMRREQKLWTLFYLVVAFLVLLAVFLLLRILYEKCIRTSDPDNDYTPPPSKGGTPDDISDTENRGEEAEKEALNLEEGT